MDALAGYASDAKSDDDAQPSSGGGGGAPSGLAAARAAGEGDTPVDARADDGAAGDGAEDATNEDQEDVAAAALEDLAREEANLQDTSDAAMGNAGVNADAQEADAEAPADDLENDNANAAVGTGAAESPPDPDIEEGGQAEPAAEQDELAEARELLQKGAKMFLAHDHDPGFLHDAATWEGQYHLAYIQEGCHPETNIFKALWARGGDAVNISYTLHSPSQVLADAKLDTMTVQIEDDDTGTTYQNARIIDLCREQPGEVHIKYQGYGGDGEMVNISQVSFGCRGRKRRKTRAAKAEAVSKGEKKRQGWAKAKRKTAGKGGEEPENKASGLREEDIIVIDSSSESSEEGEKRSGETGAERDDDEMAWKGEGALGNWGEEVSDDVNEEINDFLAKQGSSLFPNEGGAGRGSSPSGGSLGSDEGGAEEGSTSSHFSTESDMEEEGTSGGYATQQKSAGDSSSSSSEEEEDELDSRKKVVARKKAERKRNSVSSSSSGGRTRKRRVTPRKAVLPHEGNEGILMHGFCRSVSELQDPRKMAKEAQRVLDKAVDCSDDPEQFKEALVDANMLIQETLYNNLNDRTTFVKAAANNGKSMQHDGNKAIISQLVRQFDLPQEKVDGLFSRLRMSDGYYSINDAVRMINKRLRSGEEDAPTGAAEMEEGTSTERESAVEGRDGSEAVGRMEEKETNLLGSRVSKVFEDGQEYKGTVSIAHYRVKYDDGDTETLTDAEVFENLASNDKYLNGPDEMRCSMLELFSGCSLLSNLCKRRGMTVMSVDNDANSNATIKADFASDFVQSLASRVQDYIHASPECKTHSRASGGYHRTNEEYNKTKASHEADAILLKLYFFLKKTLETNKDATVTIENPVGFMQKGEILRDLYEGELGLRRILIHYCQFGRAEKKPTNIWTNDEKLADILESMGGKCKCSGPHEEGVCRSPRHKNFSALPMKLCQVISSYVHSKHTQLKFDKLASKESEFEGESC